MTDLVLAAIHAEHFASPSGYQPPAEVQAAEKARKDLIDRSSYLGYTRDEKRLLARYKRTIEAHEAALVARHFPTTAPNSEQEQVNG